MTDSHAAYIVILDRDIREDDAAWIANTLRCIRFVASVEPVPTSYEFAVARARRDRQWKDALSLLIANGPPGEETSHD